MLQMYLCIYSPGQYNQTEADEKLDQNSCSSAATKFDEQYNLCKTATQK